MESTTPLWQTQEQEAWVELNFASPVLNRLQSFGLDLISVNMDLIVNIKTETSTTQISSKHVGEKTYLCSKRYTYVM